MTNNFLTFDFKTFVLLRLSMSIKKLPNGLQTFKFTYLKLLHPSICTLLGPNLQVHIG